MARSCQPGRNGDCRRHPAQWPDAARRGGRHLPRGVGDPLAQGQGRDAGGRLAEAEPDEREVVAVLPRRQPAPAPHRPGLARPAATLPRARPRTRASSSSRCTTPSSGSRRCPAPGSQAPARRGRGRPVRPGDRRRADLAARGGHRRGPPGRPRRAGPGGARRGGRRPAGARCAGRRCWPAPPCRRAPPPSSRACRGLREVGLEVGRPVLPMLASSAPDLEAALAKAGPAAGGGRRPSSTASGSRSTGAATRSSSPPAPSTTSPHRLPEVVESRGPRPPTTVRPRRRGARARRRRPAPRLPGDRVPHRPGRAASP